MVRLLLSLTCTACSGVGALSGCEVAGVVASGIEEHKAQREHDVAAEYQGLEGKTYAVVIAADRFIEGGHPGVTDALATRMTKLLADNVAGEGMPVADALRHLYQNPRWVAMPRGEVARSMRVERLIVVDLLEYQLTEPGNQHVWAGVVAGTVGVIEAESPLPDEFAYQKQVRITFPDKEGFGPQDLSAQQVASVLIQRFTDRAAWLFYTHKEKGRMDY